MDDFYKKNFDSTKIEGAVGASAHTQNAQQHLLRTLSMGSSSFCAYLVCEAAASAHT